MSSFYFEGRMPTSKSLFIRQLVCQSYLKNWNLECLDEGEDIQNTRKALQGLFTGGDIYCGDGAAVLRFIALRAARECGRFFVRGSSRLMSRPHEEILHILKQLGVFGEISQTGRVSGKISQQERASSEISQQGIYLQSQGWKIPDSAIWVDRSISSQFISAIVLNSWGLEKPLKITWAQPTVSDGYFEMTLSVVKSLGMKIYQQANQIQIEAQQFPTGQPILEPDMSSAFAVAALAAAGGVCRILDFPSESLQPDFIFKDILAEMGLKVHLQNRCLEVLGPSDLRPIEVCLKDSPDLFPVLAVLCAFARGRSRLWGASHLIYKESNRLAKIGELLQKLGRECEPTLDGLVIRGKPFDPQTDNRFSIAFDPDQDHRLVMAACVARRFGFNIRICHMDVVAKSFPKFQEIQI